MVLIVLLVVVFVVFIVVCCVLVVVVNLLAVVLYVCLVVLMFVLLVLRECDVGSYMVGLSCFCYFVWRLVRGFGWWLLDTFVGVLVFAEVVVNDFVGCVYFDYAW